VSLYGSCSRPTETRCPTQSDTNGDVASCNDEVSTMARPNESELIVPLRNAWNITRYKRAPRAMQIIREQVIRHLKVREDEELYIDPEVNELIWKRGIENPPRKVRLLVIRHDEPDFPVEVKLMKE